MTAAMSVPGGEAQSKGPGAAVRPTLRALLGFLVGFVLGVGAVGVLWFITFAQAFSGGPAIEVPGFIAASSDGGSITTSIGPFLLVTPLGLALIGGAIGLVIGLLAPRRPRSERR